MGRGNLENGGSLKECRATAREVLFITMDVVVIIIYVTLRHRYYQEKTQVTDVVAFSKKRLGSILSCLFLV